MALTTNWQRIATGSSASFGSTIAYVYIDAKYSQQDIVNNRSLVQFRLGLSVSGGYIGTYNNQNCTLNTSAGDNYKTLANGNYTSQILNEVSGWVYHDSDGSKSVSANGNFYSQAWGIRISSSGSSTLPSIPRGSKISTYPANFNIGDTLNFTFDKKVSSYYQELVIKQTKPNDIQGTLQRVAEIDGVETSYSWTPSESLITNMENYIPNDNQCMYIFELYTYTDSTKTTQIGNEDIKYSYGNIIDANPTFTNFEYSNINDAVLNANDNDSSYFISGFSDLRVVIPINMQATSKKGAFISSYLVEWGSASKGVAYSMNEITIDGEPLSNQTTQIINVYAIDSRSNATKVTKIVTNWLDYVKPKLTSSLLVERTDSIGEETTLEFSGAYWNEQFKTDLNTINATYQYRIKGTTAYTNGTTALVLTKNGANFSCDMPIKGDTDAGFDTTKQYDIRLYLTDLVGSTPFTGDLAIGDPAMDIFKNNVALGGSYNEELGGRVQISGKPFKIIDNLESTNQYYCLSANQGRILGQAYIKENGTNANGNYIKYSNGIMICYGTRSFTDDINTDWWNGSNRSTNPHSCDYPVEFTSVISCQMQVYGIISAYLGMEELPQEHLDRTPASNVFITKNYSKSNVTFYYSYLTIGKWE